MVFSNYRPVSVLPVFSKLLELLRYNRLICFITDNKLLYAYQFDFLRGKLVVTCSRLSACPSARLSVRASLTVWYIKKYYSNLFESWNCPLKTLYVKSSDKCNHGYRSSSNMRKKWFDIYCIPEIIFEVGPLQFDRIEPFSHCDEDPILWSFYIYIFLCILIWGYFGVQRRSCLILIVLAQRSDTEGRSYFPLLRPGTDRQTDGQNREADRIDRRIEQTDG